MVFVELRAQSVLRVYNLLRHEEVAGPVGFCPWLVVLLLDGECAHEGSRWGDGCDDPVPGWFGLETAGFELAGSDLVDADGAETAECVHCWVRGVGWLVGFAGGKVFVGCGTRCANT